MSDNPPPEPTPPAEAGTPTSVTNVSGGVNLDAQHDVHIGGDVVGRDKIVSTTYITGEQQYDVHGLGNPYLGLQSFTYADHAKYAGREKLIAETVARLTAPDDPLALLFVTGASGSGKSSFVQAGVLLALEKHYAALRVKWAVFRPSRDPLAALTDALWRQLGLPQFDAHTASPTDFGDFLHNNTPPPQVNVIVIDQFEELFTQSNAQPRDVLFTWLTHLPPFRSTRTHIIATVRADYLPELFALPVLYDIAKHGIDLRAMSVDELREAIQQPLRATYPDQDKRFQAELVERLALDAAEDAAYLPLLQVTLEEIWRKGTLTVGSYTNLSDAIEQRADKVLAYRDYDAAQPDQRRPLDEQAAILGLCLNLVDVSLDDEARRDVRRRRSKDELAGGAPDRARLIDALTQARLLSVDTERGEQTVEVDLIHETLLSNWDRLRQAIAQQRHELRQRARFEQQLKEWIGQDRSDDYLLSGVHLAEARELERREDIALHSAEAKDFVRRSVAREEARRQKELDDARKLAEAEAQRAESEKQRAEEQTRSAAKLKRVLLVVALLAVAAIALGALAGVFGVQSNQAASANATLAAQNQSIANAAQTAEAKAVSEAHIRATAEISASLQRDEAQRQARLALSRQLAGQAVDELDRQLDLSLLLSIEANHVDPTVEARSSLLSALLKSPRLRTYLHSDLDSATPLAFNPAGTLLASTDVSNTIVLWDMSDPDAPQRLGQPLQGHLADVSKLSFSADGRRLASVDVDSGLAVWDVSNPTQPTPYSLPGLERGPWRAYAIFDPKRSNVLAVSSYPNGTTLWNVADLDHPTPIGYLPQGDGAGSDLVFRPDGNLLAVIGDTVDLWDVSEPATPTLASQISAGSVSFSPLSVDFSHDGRLLAVGLSSAQVKVYDVSDSTQPKFQSTIDSGYTAAFNPIVTDTLAVAAETIVLYDVGVPQSPQKLDVPLSGNNEAAYQLVFSPDGQRLASSRLGDVVLWDVTLHPHWPIQLSVAPSEWVPALAFSPDTHWLATGQHASIKLWDMSDLRKPITVSVLDTTALGQVNDLAFSADGRFLATTHENGTVLWDVTTALSPTFLYSTTQAFGHVRFNPRVPQLIAGRRDDLQLWDISEPRQPITTVVKLIDQVGTLSLNFRPDGQVLAIGGRDGTIALADMTKPYSPTLIGNPIVAYAVYAQDIAFSPDGRLLASALGDPFASNSILLWDVSNVAAPGKLGEPLEGTFNVEFSPDGRTLATSTQLLWDVSQPTLPTSLGTRLTGQRRLVFGKDGASLVTYEEDVGVIIWDLNTGDWETIACRMANRNLTPTEWQRYIGSLPYRATCHP